MQCQAHSFFLQFKKRIVEYYPELFEGGDAEEGHDFSGKAAFTQKWGWYQSLYGLARGDVGKIEPITRLNFHSCLYYLAFEKEKTELEKRLIKNG